MIRLVFSCLLLTPVAVAQVESPPADLFRSQVRDTKPLTAEEERLKLNVPAGFEITLFASEPQIQKPLNMAFDADGKLWVTGSNEYPYPASDDEGKDSIRVLEDTNGDGAADKVTVFADDLNIPIGIYPYRDGAVVFSIPNILFLRDTDGDGKADKREVLFGPFDTSRDTHGMNNSFRRGFDGWLYCCHGFNNQSTVAGSDKHSVNLQSGNTYRVRLDGSRIEHFTHGQVNPFGMAIDANGDIFNSDCHTKPVTMLIRDGFYESFGKAHDGLGFVPPVMEHLHGSTAIDGLCQYQGTAFPAEYHDDIFVGNVMTCRVHRNSVVRNGSSVNMREETDFLSSDDPWFRPVDIQIGPDGAMYIADFYNRIIGHYEVPLDHPGRDRERGRIWKVSYTGAEASQAVDRKLTQADLPELIATLNDPRKPVRQHAADQIVDRIGPDATSSLLAAVPLSLEASSQIATPQLLWCLQRLSAVQTSMLKDCYRNGTDRTRIHVMRICSEIFFDKEIGLLIRSGLRDPAPLVLRAAADAAGRHPAVEILKEVVNATAVLQDDDPHLQHALKIALRNQLRDEAVATWFTSIPQPEASVVAVSRVIAGLDGDQTGSLAASLARSGVLTGEAHREVFLHAANHVTPNSITDLTLLAQSLPGSEIELKMEVWTSLSDSIAKQKLTPTDEFIDWSIRLGESIFAEQDLRDIQWGRYQLNDQPAVDWQSEPRKVSASASKGTPFISSYPGGERGVGVLRSKAFAVPFSLELSVCGHLGPPDKAAIPENRIILRDFSTGAELESLLPPRSDIAQKTKWNLVRHIGTKAYIEVVDGISQPSFAWVAIGRVTPRVVDGSEFDGGRSSAMLAAVIKFHLSRQQSGATLTEAEAVRLYDIVGAIQVDGETRGLAAEALLNHHKQPYLNGIASLLKIAATPRTVDAAIVEYCDPRVSPDNKELPLLRTLFGSLDDSLRNQLAAALSENEVTSRLLLDCIESGVPSADILRDDRLVQQVSAFSETLANRVKAQVNDLPDESADTAALTANIIRRLRLGEGDTEAGSAIFAKHCAACHRRGQQGALVGPQIDNIGTRGTTRLLEDILHPNRNVDVAFRTSVLLMKDGRALSGMVRTTRDPALLEVIDTQGKKETVNVAEIEDRKDSTVSLMPGNVAKLLTEDELLSLVLWLSK